MECSAVLYTEVICTVLECISVNFLFGTEGLKYIEVQSFTLNPTSKQQTEDLETTTRPGQDESVLLVCAVYTIHCIVCAVYPVCSI